MSQLFHVGKKWKTGIFNSGLYLRLISDCCRSKAVEQEAVAKPFTNLPLIHCMKSWNPKSTWLHLSFRPQTQITCILWLDEGKQRKKETKPYLNGIFKVSEISGYRKKKKQLLKKPTLATWKLKLWCLRKGSAYNKCWIKQHCISTSC